MTDHGPATRPGHDGLDRQERQIRGTGRPGAGVVQAAACGEKVEQVVLGQEEIGVPVGLEPRFGATAVGGVLVAVAVDEVDGRIGKGGCQSRQGMPGQPVAGTDHHQDVPAVGADGSPDVAPGRRGREADPGVGRPGIAGRGLKQGTPPAVGLPLEAAQR